MYQYIKHINSSKQAPQWLGCTYVPSSFILSNVEDNRGENKSGIN